MTASGQILDRLVEGTAGAPAELVQAVAGDSRTLGIPSIAFKIGQGEEVHVCKNVFVDGSHSNIVVYPTYIGVFLLGDSSASWRLHMDDAKRPLAEIASELGLKANFTASELRALGFDEFI